MNTHNLPCPTHQFAGPVASQWEPPNEHRRTWRRALPGGDYEYRDTAPTEREQAKQAEPQQGKSGAASAPQQLPTSSVAPSVQQQPVTPQELATSAATMPSDWPQHEEEGVDEEEDEEDEDEYGDRTPLEDPDDAAIHQRLMGLYHNGGANIRRNVMLTVARAFHAMSRGDWDEDHSPGAGQALLDNLGQSAEVDDLTGRLDQHERDHFEETYFDQDSADGRAEKAYDFITESPGWFDELSGDTQAAMIEDLVYSLSQDRDKLITALDDGYDRDGAEDPLFRAAIQAATNHTPPKQISFNKPKPDQSYRLVDIDELDEDQQAAFRAYLHVAPKVGILTAPNQVVVDSSVASVFLDDFTGGDIDWDDDHDMHDLFNSLPAAKQIGADAAPLSARNAGNVAGGGASGAEAIEVDWNVNDHDVYKRLSPTSYIVKRGEAQNAARSYEIVPAKKTPPLTRLPDAYWSNFDEETHGRDESKVDEMKEKQKKRTKESKLKPEIKTQQSRAKELNRDHDNLIAKSHVVQAIRDKDQRIGEMIQETEYDAEDFYRFDLFEGDEAPGEWIDATETLADLIRDWPEDPKHVTEYDDYTASETDSAGQDEYNITDQSDRKNHVAELKKHNKKFESEVEELRKSVEDDAAAVRNGSAEYRKAVAGYVEKVKQQIEKVKTVLGDSADIHLTDLESNIGKLGLLVSPRRKTRGVNGQQS